jgi:hypothetical protein
MQQSNKSNYKFLSSCSFIHLQDVTRTWSSIKTFRQLSIGSGYTVSAKNHARSSVRKRAGLFYDLSVRKSLPVFLLVYKRQFRKGSQQGCQMFKYIFKPKILIWVNFAGSCNARCWWILWPFGIFCGHFVYSIVIWYIFPVLVCSTSKNLATLVRNVIFSVLEPRVSSGNLVRKLINKNISF